MYFDNFQNSTLVGCLALKDFRLNELTYFTVNEGFDVWIIYSTKGWVIDCFKSLAGFSMGDCILDVCIGIRNSINTYYDSRGHKHRDRIVVN